MFGGKKVMCSVITGSTETDDSYMNEIGNVVEEVTKLFIHLVFLAMVSESRTSGRNQNPACKKK